MEGIYENESHRRSGKYRVGIIVTIFVIALVASKCILFLLYRKWSKNRTDKIKLSGGKMVLFTSSGKTIPPTSAIIKKTEALKSKDIIGFGGYGTVYRLVLDDQTSFAVKKLRRDAPEKEKGYQRELETLSDIKHRNLVTLRGYFSAPHVNLLIYDLMPNGNLESALHNDREALDWPSRHKIALGAALGIAYLHNDCIPHIIHRDIKSSNILLDERMEARVADFGLAKLIDPGHTHATTIVAGTFGYLAPEYVDTGKASEKGDIYSYGVVLLELVTGKKPTDVIFAESGINLVPWVRNLVARGRAKEAFDKNLLSTVFHEEIREVAEIACQCLDLDPQRRPTMTEVVKMLERMDRDRNMLPTSMINKDLESQECSSSSSAFTRL